MGPIVSARDIIMLYVPKFLGAILILLVGLLVAKAIASAAGKLVEKNSKIKEGVNKLFGDTEKEIKVGRLVVKSIYYIVMIFVIIAVFEALGFTRLTQPLNSFLGSIFSFIPQIIGAIILLAIAWVAARILKFLVVKALKSVKVDEKMKTQREGIAPLSQTVGEIVYWFVFLIFLPAILSALSLGGILSPIQNMIDKIFQALPNLVAAALIIAIGWFIASKIKKAVTQILESVGIDRIGAKEDQESKNRLSEIIGTIVYVLILIPVFVAGFDMIGLKAISAPAVNMLDSVMNFIPSLFSAFVIVYIAYFIGRIVGDLVSRILGKLNIEKIFSDIGLVSPEKSGERLPNMVGYLVKVAIVFFAVLEAANILGLTMFADIVDQFIVLAGHILLGIVIIGIGLYLAQLVASIIGQKKSASSEMLSIIAKGSIIVLSLAMGLRQMGIANEIINMAFGFTIGAIAIAGAIAFGIGGKDAAAKALSKFGENDEKAKEETTK
ncbi:Conserved TM helix [Peptoclostridium litorale DSM 5388]|uniref:Uncharacterized protein n=1 Tax=Peptoclostridium litorale DSM 5388 TaxID=1121324 RepID=A0A069RDS2_PEPLI|nr:mechanosensitive ion channel [Peptoclostridium litorale]KDR94355.1 hypothetical protein CLIT_21c00050 [Peptoclostridium litorale DSM 5388]SIO37422.1 Conserved TM helix [Peptoclostridium litorale DSM 5388]